MDNGPGRITVVHQVYTLYLITRGICSIAGTYPSFMCKFFIWQQEPGPRLEQEPVQVRQREQVRQQEREFQQQEHSFREIP